VVCEIRFCYPTKIRLRARGAHCLTKSHSRVRKPHHPPTTPASDLESLQLKTHLTQNWQSKKLKGHCVALKGTPPPCCVCDFLSSETPPREIRFGDSEIRFSRLTFHGKNCNTQSLGRGCGSECPMRVAKFLILEAFWVTFSNLRVALSSCLVTRRGGLV